MTVGRHNVRKDKYFFREVEGIRKYSGRRRGILRTFGGGQMGCGGVSAHVGGPVNIVLVEGPASPELLSGVPLCVRSPTV